MKATSTVTIVAVLLIFSSLSIVRGQGNLTPPGAPAPTMKTLDQVEPRIPITGGASPISQSGSYYLTENSSRQIIIEADDVTLDLMGFHIAVSSGNAITISRGYGNNTLIRNGTLQPGYRANALDGRDADDCRFEDLRIVSTNTSYGISAGDHCVIRNCDVRNCSNRGISVGDNTEIRNCRVIGGKLDGILAGSGCRIIANVTENNVKGINVGDNTEIRDCHVVGGKLDGIWAGSGCRIIGNVIENNGGKGLYITGSKTYVENNIVKGNGNNYDFAVGNQLNILLCEIPETLDWPCSVKLAGRLACIRTPLNGITVAANNVTINMDGHTLMGPGAFSGHGIYQSSLYSNLRVFNGKFTSWREGSGIYASGKANSFSDLQASQNNTGIYTDYYSTLSGCTASYNTSRGLSAGPGSTISDCVAGDNGGGGIHAGGGSTISGCAANDNGDNGIHVFSGCTISDCTALDNGGKGIETERHSTISGCTVRGNGEDGIFVEAYGTINNCMVFFNGGNGIVLGNNIYVANASMISDCTTSYNSDNGIFAAGGTIVKNCVAVSNTGDGIKVSSGSRVISCNCKSNGLSSNGSGIHATGTRNHIDGNTLISNKCGIDVDSAGNFIVRNAASGNTPNYNVASSNLVGHIQTAFSGIGSNAWDNFIY